MVSKDHQPARQNVEDEKVFCKFRQLDDDFIMGVLSALEDEGIEAAFRFTLDNKKAILHICNSVNRNIYEQYLMRICEYVVTTYFDTVFEKDIVSKSNRDIMILFTKCELFGLSIDWINTGMQDDAIEKLKHLLLLCNGLSSEMIKKCKENSEHNET